MYKWTKKIFRILDPNFHIMLFPKAIGYAKEQKKLKPEDKARLATAACVVEGTSKSKVWAGGGIDFAREAHLWA